MFTLPQQDLGRVNAAFAKGPLPVEALRSDNDDGDRQRHAHGGRQPGRQTTGTVKLKAEFPNADLQLWPGQFVNVRLLVDTLKQVVVIPTGAVQRGPERHLRLRRQGRQHGRACEPVAVARQDETQAVVDERRRAAASEW